MLLVEVMGGSIKKIIQPPKVFVLMCQTICQGELHTKFRKTGNNNVKN